MNDNLIIVLSAFVQTNERGKSERQSETKYSITRRQTFSVSALKWFSNEQILNSLKDSQLLDNIELLLPLLLSPSDVPIRFIGFTVFRPPTDVAFSSCNYNNKSPINYRVASNISSTNQTGLVVVHRWARGFKSEAIMLTEWEEHLNRNFFLKKIIN